MNLVPFLRIIVFIEKYEDIFYWRKNFSREKFPPGRKFLGVNFQEENFTVGKFARTSMRSCFSCLNFYWPTQFYMQRYFGEIVQRKSSAGSESSRRFFREEDFLRAIFSMGEVSAGGILNSVRKKLFTGVISGKNFHRGNFTHDLKNNQKLNSFSNWSVLKKKNLRRYCPQKFSRDIFRPRWNCPGKIFHGRGHFTWDELSLKENPLDDGILHGGGAGIPSIICKTIKD